MAGNVRNIPGFVPKNPENGNKQKITVVEIVSTTVTDLVAGAGFEPPTSGLWEPESTGKTARKAKAWSTSSAVYDDELTTASFYASFFNAFLGLARSTTALSGREKQIAGKYAGEALSGKLQEKQLMSSTVDFISQFPGDFEHDI